MPEKTIYQTLEDRCNLREVEMYGPFPCNESFAWLGNGYYFWDSFIENAKWWGEFCRKSYANGYIICEAICDINDVNCFDLVGNTEHLFQFRKLITLLRDNGDIKPDTKISTIFHLLIDKGLLKYEATRIIGELVKARSNIYSISYYFDYKERSYFELIPPIQICLYSKSSLGLRNFKVIYSKDLL